MKRIILALIIVICFSSCQTYKPYTEISQKEPIQPGWSYLSGLYPGVTQFINGEPIEGLVYLGSVIGTAVIAAAIQGDTPGDQLSDQQFAAMTPFILAAGAVWIWSYADGVSSSYKRADDYKAFKLANSRFKDEEKRAIENKQVFIGMSEGALIMSLGKPEDINTSVGSWGTKKQYCYSGYRYVYIENGVITSLQF